MAWPATMIWRCDRPLLRVGGGGRQSGQRGDRLPIETTLVRTLTGQGGKSLDKVKGVTVPVHVTGSFSDPKESTR